MRKRRIYLGLLLLAVAIAAMVVFREPEPKCWGKRLSQWVDELPPYGHATTQAGNAVREIGTNSVPYLLKWIAYDPPLLKRIYYHVRRKLLKRPEEDPNEVRAEKALEAFYFLGPEGRAAIPRLCELVKDGGGRAECALAYLGKDGYEALWATLANSPRGLVGAFDLVGHIGGTETGRMNEDALPAIPGLIRFLKHGDEKVAERAAKVLGELELASDVVVPALAECLQDSRWKVRWQAANSLGFLRADAKAAVPALIRALDDANFSVRWNATNALAVIEASRE